MCRSWTLQEGELPGTITVQFLDRAVVFGRASEEDGLYQERFTARRFPLLEVSGEPVDIDASTSRHTEKIGLEPIPSFDGGCIHDNPSPLECRCVEITLQRNLNDTFFQEVKDFVTVWNALAGRSTIMSRDVPVIMINIMDLDHGNLLAYHDAGQMFQAVMLSLSQLPLSIFFNIGPKHDPHGNHQNRRVLVQISADTLVADNFLTVYPSYLQ